jgi:hypothetical protein
VHSGSSRKGTESKATESKKQAKAAAPKNEKDTKGKKEAQKASFIAAAKKG